MKLNIALSQTKTLRGRKVYDVITLISEISGLADMLFVAATFLLGIFYTPFLVEAALHKHMGPQVKVKPTKKTRKVLKIDKSSI